MNAFEEEYYLWMLDEAVSQCSIIFLNAASDGVFKRKCSVGKLYFI